MKRPAKYQVWVNNPNSDFSELYGTYNSRVDAEQAIAYVDLEYAEIVQILGDNDVHT